MKMSGGEIVARWSDWDGAGLEHCRIVPGEHGIDVEAAVIDAGGFAARYAIRCDPLWRVRRAEVALLGGPSILLRSDGAGRWIDHAGAALPELDGAIDIDIQATPFTNSLPIRRLGLSEGAAAEIEVAYVEMPTLALSRRPQRYLRLDARRYRFTTLDHDFSREIEIDADGLVVVYPGLFRRVS